MEPSLAGKRAVVTGAGKGIGRATAKALLACGAEVIAVTRTQSDLDSLVQECPKMMTICVDLGNWEATENALKDIRPVDLLVNNAAIAIVGPFLEVTQETIDHYAQIEVCSVLPPEETHADMGRTYKLLTIIAKGMKCRGVGGAIVNLSSQASQCVLKDHAVYCATKSAVDMLTKAMALELGPHKIRVNAVNPTVVMTAMGQIAWSDPIKSAGMLSRIPLGRFAEIEDVVNAIIFLLSDKSAMINGVILPVDGGFLAS